MHDSLVRRKVVTPMLGLLRQGVTPTKLAWSVALGIGLGLVPVLGASTALCAAAALALRLNLPAIQLVNYLLTPMQLLLIIPQLRFGEWLARAPAFPVTLDSGLALIAQGPLEAARVMAVAIGHATLGWLVLAPPVTVLLFLALESAFRRLKIPTPEVAQ